MIPLDLVLDTFLRVTGTPLVVPVGVRAEERDLVSALTGRSEPLGPH